MTEDYCFKCKSLMAEIDIGGNLGRCFVCVDNQCERFGLLSVVGLKKMKKGGEIDANLPAKMVEKRNRQEN